MKYKNEKFKIKFIYQIFIIIPILVLFAKSVFGEASLLNLFSKGSNNDIPIHITSDRMEGFNKKNLIIFYGNVKAIRADTTLWADRMDIFLEREEKKIDRIVAFGNVKVNQEDRNAKATKATYFENGMKIVLEGNPQVWQKEDVMKGDKITLFLNEDRVLVETADAQIRPKTISEGEKRVTKDETK